SAIQSEDVTAYLGHTVDVRFHFTSDSVTIDPTNQDPGWNLDLVQVTESGATTVPSAPQSLAVTSASSTAIGLGWSAPASNGGSAVTSYSVYRGTSSGTETLLASGVTTTTYSDASVASGTTYFYTVT